jgi:hypothetical protein
MTHIYREFGSYEKNGKVIGISGSIFVNITKNDNIEILINGLIDEHMMNTSFMIIEYDKKCDFEILRSDSVVKSKFYEEKSCKMYDSIIKILDILSYDLHYQFTQREPYHKDFIIKRDRENFDRKIWNVDTDIMTNDVSDIWLPFTRENMKYIEKVEHGYFLYEMRDDYFIFKGSINKNYEFLYDSPIINSYSKKEYYISTRGMKQTDLT